MSMTTKAIASVFILLASSAFAETEASDPAAIARENLMKSFGGAAKTLGQMAGGQAAYDATAAAAAKASLTTGAAEIAAAFAAPTMDPADKTSPDVWKNWDDFLAKGKALGDAAAALDVASAESIGAAMGAIGGACKDCHTLYRMK
ncbi:cytochrome c [Cypionkella sp.]|uniref:cytochrome c n=1 Tax=Cypionkella sp. TaxID=2811411 RepID=UPI003751CCB9